MKAYLNYLKVKRPQLRLISFICSSLALCLTYFLALRLLIPALESPATIAILILQFSSALAVFLLITLLASELKQKLRASLGFGFLWMSYAVIFIYLATAIGLLPNLFGPYYSQSYSLGSGSTLHIYEQDCWIDSATECDDYYTALHIQQRYSPFMRQITSCPCYLNTATQDNGKLEFSSSSCTDDKERTLLISASGRLELNSCQ